MIPLTLFDRLDSIVDVLYPYMKTNVNVEDKKHTIQNLFYYLPDNSYESILNFTLKKLLNDTKESSESNDRIA